MSEPTNAGVTAKRGDLVLVEHQRSYGDRRSEWRIERVTSVTRDGWVRDCVHRWYGTEMSEPLWRWTTHRGRRYRDWRVEYRQHWVIRRAAVDVDRLWEAWCKREQVERSERFPEGVRWQPEPFASHEEALAFCKPFKRVEVEA